MSNKIFYIDPQSMHNLAEYDYSVTKNMDCEIIYICSKYYDYDINPKLTYIYAFKYNHIKNRIKKAVSYLFSLIYIAVLINEYKPNLVHIQWFKIPKLDYFFWSIIKKIFHVHIIHTAHNVLPHNTGTKHQAIYKKIYTNLSDKIIVHSANTKKEICNIFNIDQDKIAIIRHGLLTMKYNEEKYKKQFKNSALLEKLENKIVFTSLGEQSYYKGSDLIIEAWLRSSTLNQSDKCVLVMAGKFKNIDYKEVEKYKNVFIKNIRVSNEEYMFWLSHTDAYLLPYRNISQSGALLTALSEHIPVVTTNAGGISEPMSIAKVGWNIGEANVENIQTTLLHILKNSDETKKIKQNQMGWKAIEDFYNWDEISYKTEMLYQLTTKEKLNNIHKHD